MKTVAYTLALAAALLGAAASAHAQAEKGRNIVGLSAGFFLQNSSDFDAQWQVILNPSVLHLVTDDLAIGGGLTLGLENFGFDPFGNGNRTQFRYGIAPEARYYLTDGDGGRLFAEASVGVSGTTREGDDAVAVLGAGLGYSLFFNEGLAVEPGVNVAYRTGDFSFVQVSIAMGLQGFVDSLLPGGE